MAKVHIVDDVLRSILAQLPGKPLLRLRCTSKHWNHIISDPYFMKLRSRRMILLPFPPPLVVIDDNIPVEDSMVRVRSPLEHHQDGTQVCIVGTLNDGIVLLAIYDASSLKRCHLILYNPLTCASKTLVVMDPLYINCPIPYVLGFGSCGDDLKIVRFEFMSPPVRYKFDVFDLKTSSWSIPLQYLKADFHFLGNTGTFLNGFLYWSTSTGILALNVKDMIMSKISPPKGLERIGLLLGSLDGCLCTVIKIGLVGFDVWLWKEQYSSWRKVRSFVFGGLERVNTFHPICILGNGKIVMTNNSMQLVIYDTSKHSYKTLSGLATLDGLKTMCRIFKFKHVDEIYHFKDIRSIEYVESLVSPSDMCYI